MLRIDEEIRRSAFWIFDKIKGKQIYTDFDDVRFILENHSNEASFKLRHDYLHAIIRHARLTTPFYRNILSDELQDFPVINKNIIRENLSTFLSAGSNFKEVTNVVTSGSTGTPFCVKQDKRKKLRNTADTIFFGELAGFWLGQRLYYFKIWNEINKKSFFTQLTHNIVPCDVTRLDDIALSKIVLSLENDKSNKGLLAYSSVYDALSLFLRNNNHNPINNNITSVIAMSESLDAMTKKSISHFLCVNAVSRYSNMENGIIAQQLTDGSDEFVINDASYFIEILDLDSDVPSPEGIPGRIVVTDLFNYCMPIIRYDTGDIGSITRKEIFNDVRQVFKSIEGRRMDLIYDTSGSLLSSYVITNNMWKYKDVKQYQFIQNSDKDYLFILNTDQPFLRENELISEFRKYLGNDSNITVEYKKEIPVLASGKRRKVINKIQKQ
jgi:phenylacetate-CoA ligase